MNKLQLNIITILFLIFLSNISHANIFSTEKKILLENEKNTINIFQKTANSVVNISNIRLSRMGWFNMSAVEIPAGAGSGFVWDKKGHIVTNYHVIKGGNKFIVTFKNDKKQYIAKLVGGEPRKDIAVLKLVEIPKKISPMLPGISKNLQVGQKAMAIGNPFGLDHTITSGIISGTGRKIPGVGGVKIHGMIQTDASINPGNSGGALINSTGELIGMNTVIYSNSGASAGVGFAVPVDTIKRIVPQLIKYGRVIRPGLGLSILEDYQRNYFGIRNGIVIGHVYENTGAAASDLRGISQDHYGRYKLGDIIVKIDGKKVKDFDQLYHALDQHKVGDSVSVGYLRKGVYKTTSVKLSKVNFD